MPPSDPLEIFRGWFTEAAGAEPGVPDAATLATVGPGGQPSARIVLVRRVTGAGFEFHTDYHSQKGRELADNPRAALTYHWRSLGRQVRVEGTVGRLSAEESDRYWYGRPRGSRLSARSSEQSEPMGSRAELLERWAREDRLWGPGEVERPAHWGGYRLIPARIEFWTHQDDRAHERLNFTREHPGAPWTCQLLQP